MSFPSFRHIQIVECDGLLSRGIIDGFIEGVDSLYVG